MLLLLLLSLLLLFLLLLLHVLNFGHYVRVRRKLSEIVTQGFAIMKKKNLFPSRACTGPARTARSSTQRSSPPWRGRTRRTCAGWSYRRERDRNWRHIVILVIFFNCGHVLKVEKDRLTCLNAENAERRKPPHRWEDEEVTCRDFKMRY